MNKIKQFFNDRLGAFKALMVTLKKALLAYNIDTVLGLFGLVVGIVGLFTNLFLAFVGIVLAMHSVYTAYRLNSKITE